PLDAAPLEKLKAIYLSEKNLSSAIAVLNTLNTLKKDYPPYWADLGRLQRSGDKLNRAVELDPATMLQESTYLDLTMISNNEGSANLYKYLMYQPRWFEIRTRTLIDQIPEDTFLNEAILFAQKNAISEDDKLSACDHFALSLMHLRKQALAA